MHRSIAYIRNSIVAPALAELADAARLPQIDEPAAIDLVMGTAAVESGFIALHQVGGGPALGLWQIEPATARDIQDHFLSYRPRLDAAVKAISHGPADRQLAADLAFGAVMCRLIYLRCPRPLPRAGDVAAYGAYWKAHYNTCLGAGTEEKFRTAWAQLIAPTLQSEMS